MKETLLLKSENFQWIDFENPTQQDLEKIGSRFNLHKTSIQDCLDPEHLPKLEIISDLQFLILRAPEENPPDRGVSVQDLTRKIAVFVGPQFLITIHRASLNCIEKAPLLRQLSNVPSDHSSEALSFLVESVLLQFEKTIDSFFSQLDQLEASAFNVPGSKNFKLKTAYYFKRKTFVYKMIIKFTRDAINRMSHNSTTHAPFIQNLKENCESLYSYVDELYENINTLISLHVSLSTQKTTEASHRTGEIVRILTLFSIFLLPLNVITGIYGMNFTHMPELNSPWGYPLALFSMLLIVLGTYLYLKKRGWLVFKN
ncbi:MAG: CorA family divalent cation transporter [Bdellovibrionales bacterium]